MSNLHYTDEDSTQTKFVEEFVRRVIACTTDDDRIVLAKEIWSELNAAWTDGKGWGESLQYQYE